MGSQEKRHLNQPAYAIAVMAKRPEPGKVKTRLCPPLSPGQAADLYEAFFLDTVSLVSGMEYADTFIVYDPDTALDFFSRRVSAPLRCIPQGPGDLGDRLPRICHRIFSQGYRKLVILASDTPHLPQDVIRRAFARLDDTDMVLGPCDDGGYYLIGSRFSEPLLFEGIPWSTADVLNRTVGRVQDAGMTCELLPPCYDIDTEKDVRRLMLDLQENASDDTNTCTRTRVALAGLAHVLKR
jgi:rSAM/selenodomain-associated transferase 1